MDRSKIRNGGLYLIDFKGNVNPEFGLTHYCVLVATEDRDIFLSFPTTTSKKIKTEKYHHILNIDGSIVLFKHTRFISRQRIIGERTRDGVLSVLSEDELKELLNDYKMYTDRISEEAIKSSHNYHDARNKSKNKLKLKCVESCEVFVNEKIDFDSLVIEIDGGKLSHTEISTKTPCIKTVNLSVKDEYGQKITKTVKINILEKE